MVILDPAIEVKLNFEFMLRFLTKTHVLFLWGNAACVSKQEYKNNCLKHVYKLGIACIFGILLLLECLENTFSLKLKIYF